MIRKAPMFSCDYHRIIHLTNHRGFACASAAGTLQNASTRVFCGADLGYFADIRNKNTGKKIVIVAEDEDDATAYAEGKASYAIHRKLERNPKLASKAKNNRLKATGDLRSDVCNFSFQKCYGPIGVGFIEAHHTVPISKFKGRKTITRLEDIALVCSNCHRMLHRVTPLPSIADLRKRVKKTALSASER